MAKNSKSPWPTQAVMEQIYQNHLWGGKEFDFYSGEGSHDLTIINRYLEAVINFLKSHHDSLTVCDLGCGDFNIGKHLVKHTKKYTAVDIVEGLIDRNKALFKGDNLEFQCLDISKNEFPKADCVILRQVLQHLSNSEIRRILNKISRYKYIILTEHLPISDFVPNKDKIACQGIRLKQNSGVNIVAEPFNFDTEQVEILNEAILGDKKSIIVTSLYTTKIRP